MKDRRPTLLLLCALLPLAACGDPHAPTAAPPAAPAKHACCAETHEADEARADGTSLHLLESVWTDQDGVEVRLHELAGEVRIVTMIFTRCEYACPAIVADLQRIEAALPADARERVRFVLFSLDPERDTPAGLRAFATRHGLDADRWRLLRAADEADTRELAAVLGTRYRRAGDALTHASIVTVLDAAGRIVHQEVGLGAPPAPTVKAVLDVLRARKQRV